MAEIEDPTTSSPTHALHFRYIVLCLLIIIVILGNTLVILTVFVDKKLRSAATNKFIASLAFSDLLVGACVMPLALYVKINDDKWELGDRWCQFHLMTAVFSTTASIIHLVAISLDRYFAIIFPTEYQRHSVSTSASPYIVMIWFISLAISCTSFLEDTRNDFNVCWIEDPQYLILSSLIAFFLPASTVIYLYGKIFRKLRRHLFLFSAIANRNHMPPPKVIVEEVRSRRGSRMDSQESTSRRGSISDQCQQRSMSAQLTEANIMAGMARYRSPTICADTLDRSNGKVKFDVIEKDRVENQKLLNTKRDSTDKMSLPNDHHIVDVSIHNESPSVHFFVNTDSSTASKSNSVTSIPNGGRYVKKSESIRKKRPIPNPLFLSVPTSCNTPPVSPSAISSDPPSITLAVPSRDYSPEPPRTPSSHASTRSSLTTNSTDETYDRRSSGFSYMSSISDSSIDADSRRPSSLSEMDRKLSGIAEEGEGRKLSGKASKGKLRRIAAQVTRAVRRKRRESMAIRRETRATRLVAAILIAFILCWLPYFCVTVYRGVCIGLKSCNLDVSVHIQAYLITSWLGYIHSCFNPLIYTCLNKSFRKTLRRMVTGKLFQQLR